MEKNKKVISLLGCGWLGFPLAIDLISQGYILKASTTSSEKLELMKQSKIDPYLVQFSLSETPKDIDVMLDANVIVISVPPGRRDPDGPKIYKKMISELCERIPRSKIGQVILISSTSVYPEHNQVVDEFSDLSPTTESGILMAESEKMLKAVLPNIVILRLAGLIGPGRMPGKFFADKKGISGGLAPINLIHRKDAIRIIRRLIESENAYGVFNGCAPSHPSREEFYGLASQIEKLVPPQFISEMHAWKIVSSARLEEELNFKFEISSLMDWLRNQQL